MISKETFVKTMECLKKFDDDMSAVDNAFRKLGPDFCSFYLTTPVDMIMNILEDIFKDEEHWLDYCTFELDYLAKYEHGVATDAFSGRPIDLSTWEKVYDFLIENMEG